MNNEKISDDDDAYLIVPEEHIRRAVPIDAVWAKISDDGKEAIIRWDIVEMYATEFDSLTHTKRDKTQTHVLCKLMVLVRDQVRKEYDKA
jgi:hypothetical protein